MKSKLVPALRFPEFKDCGEWEKKALGEIASSIKKRATQGQKVLTLSSEYGIISQDEYFGRQIASENTAKYIEVKKNDFIYNDRITKESKYGTIRRLTRHEIGIVSPIYKCFRFFSDEESCFWEYYFSTNLHESEYKKLANEGARGGRYNISSNKLLTSSVLTPKLGKEQQKIADCLSSLDKKIEAENNKLKSLKEHKKGLLQELFPKEGANVPNLRFAEFEEDGVWEEKRLGFHFNIQMCKRIMKNQTKPTGEVPFYKIGTIGSIPDSYISQELFEEYKHKFNYPKLGEVLITCSGTVGKSFCFDGKDAYFQDSNIVWLSNKTFCISNKFIYNILSNYKFVKLDKSTIMRIYGDDLRQIKLSFPSLPEQQKIADCLTSLDELIEKHENKLELLKEHKKGLMQGLFPNVDRQKEHI